ncbi:MAG: cupin domain-containing protein [Thermoleophilaceae bacterium]|jgi:quercetin dioxygenase-like cupin family protein
MKTWDISGLDVVPHKPHIVSTTDAARVIALNLPAGERMQEHEVHERAWVVVVDGEIELEADGETAGGGAGLMVEFEPGEVHEVRAKTDARFLLFLAPWPGDGHPGAMTLDEKAHVRERAREHSSE